MEVRGRVTRLPFSTGNPLLPKLINYNYADVLSQLLAWPTLRAFFDFSDRTTMTETGGEVVSVAAKAGAFTATAGAGDRGVYNASAFNGQPALAFNGSKYAVPGLFSGGTKVTIAAGVMSTAPTTTSRMILASTTLTGRNFYAGGDTVVHMNGAVSLPVPGFRNRMVNTIWTLNGAGGGSIYADDLNATGTVTTLPAGNANIGAWYDAVGNENNNFLGNLGYLAVFEEDAGQSAVLRGLLREFVARRWRTAT